MRIGLRPDFYCRQLGFEEQMHPAPTFAMLTRGDLRLALSATGGGIVTGVGGKQVLVNDPSGNPIELFEATRDEARLEGSKAGSQPTYEMRPIGWVESTLVVVADAPNQGDEGAPDAWLVINEDVREGVRDLKAGLDVIVVTWFDRARRDELATVPGDDPTSPELGVFSTRSPARPNPVGLHRVPIVEIDGPRIHVRNLAAVDGTALVDIKPVLDSRER